jgi:mono/diheme cytochrome c family protein
MIWLPLLLALAPSPARADEPALAFLSGGKTVLSVTAADLRQRPDARVIELADPNYGRRKRYRAVPVKNLLAAAYGPAWIEDGVGEFFFDALDGYVAHAKLPILGEDGGWLAFEDVDAPGWEILPKEKLRPGPFYLVWIAPEQSPEKGYPWPWQIASIKSGIVEDLYPKAVPRNYSPKSRAPSGWATFSRRCLSCHAMGGQGGAVGPDLNEPRGITRYRGEKELKAYIREASSFRHTKMPDFTDLSAEELDDLMAYFEFMTVQAGTK